MSWDSYISGQLIQPGGASQGAILGLDGSTWAASEGFTVSPTEAQFIVNAFKDSTAAKASGIKVCNTKYLFLRDSDTEIYGKKGQTGICLMKTTQAIIVARYDENIQPGKCNDVCGKLAQYLISVGY